MRSSFSGSAVDPFPDQVSVTVVAGVLADELGEVPPNAEAVAVTHLVQGRWLYGSLNQLVIAETVAPRPAGSLISVSSKSERRAAREDVATYHEEQLSLLVTQVAESIDRFRAGELDAFDVDRVLLQYSRADKDLWKFCSLGPVEPTASLIRTDPPSNWWVRAAPRQR